MLPSIEFVRELRSADSEKLIESIYHNELRKGINSLGGHVGSLKTLYNTDGVLDGEFYFDGTAKVFRIIIETKSDETFTNAVTRSKVLTQVIYYLKRFEESGDDLLPNIIFVGDRDECFVVHTNYLQNYLNFNCDWTIAPSRAASQSIELVEALINDDDLQTHCFVHIIDDNFDFSDVTNQIYNLTIDIKMNVRITERNISKIFERFSMHILKRKSTGESQYTPREQVEFFMKLVLHQDDCYLHPRKKGKAVLLDTEVSVEPDAFSSFLAYYEFNYNVLEKKEFTAIADRLIEDSDRRRKGDFYTPTLWVDEAHKLLSQNLGAGWKDEYTVWDCAWGTGNLTRDYKFWDLYCSTLHDHDLKIGAKYNQDAKSKFQYDFLNDDVTLFDELLQKVNNGNKLTERDFYGTKLWNSAPNLVRGMLQGKKLLFFINPPYGRGSELANMLGGTRQAKKGIQKTAVNQLMLDNQIGASSANLYTQFIYRISCLRELFNLDITVGMFTPSAYLTGESFKGLRSCIVSKGLNYVTGMMFPASQFADVASNWAISFTLLGDSGVTIQGDTFNIDVKDLLQSEIRVMRTKVLYNLDNKVSGLTFARSSKKSKKVNRPIMSSALKVVDDEMSADEDAIFQLGVNTNIVEKNGQGCSLLNSKFKGWAFVDGKKDNFSPALSYFSARRMITGKYGTWENGKDEYMKPNTSHPSYAQWESDCIVYALFNVGCNIASLRNVSSVGTEFDIYNNFFFMLKEEIRQLALGSNPNDEVFDDIENHGVSERFVYEKLQQVQLSPDAQAVLDKARQLVRDSFKYRKLFDREHPEYHINSWDASWYQIKALLKVYMPEQLKEFNHLYKSLEDRMRPLVVELGFLYDYPGYEKEKPSLEG